MCGPPDQRLPIELVCGGEGGERRVPSPDDCEEGLGTRLEKDGKIEEPLEQYFFSVNFFCRKLLQYGCDSNKIGKYIPNDLHNVTYYIIF